MESAESPQEIVICLGSSCFARGNCDHLATIKSFLEEHNMKSTVRLSGLLCQDQCKQGPNVSIGGELHHEVTSSKLIELLHRLRLQGHDNGQA
jgi:NADH:ubiquinone oxidoreductase subunit E